WRGDFHGSATARSAGRAQTPHAAGRARSRSNPTGRSGPARGRYRNRLSRSTNFGDLALFALSALGHGRQDRCPRGSGPDRPAKALVPDVWRRHPDSRPPYRSDRRALYFTTDRTVETRSGPDEAG